MGSLGRSCCRVKACLEHPLRSPHRSTLDPASGKGGARARPRGPRAATPSHAAPQAPPHARTQRRRCWRGGDVAEPQGAGRRGGRAAARPNARMLPPRLEEASKAARSDARKAPLASNPTGAAGITLLSRCRKRLAPGSPDRTTLAEGPSRSIQGRLQGRQAASPAATKRGWILRWPSPRSN